MERLRAMMNLEEYFFSEDVCGLLLRIPFVIRANVYRIAEVKQVC